MGLFSGGTTTLYKWAAIGFVVLSLAVGAGWWGYNRGVNESKVVIAQYAQKNSDLQNRINTIQPTIVDRVITKYVTRTVTIKEAQIKNDAVAQADVADKPTILSSTWVCIYNHSIAGTDASECNQPAAGAK